MILVVLLMVFFLLIWIPYLLLLQDILFAWKLYVILFGKFVGGFLFMTMVQILYTRV